MSVEVNDDGSCKLYVKRTRAADGLVHEISYNGTWRLVGRKKRTLATISGCRYQLVQGEHSEGGQLEVDADADMEVFVDPDRKDPSRVVVKGSLPGCGFDNPTKGPVAFTGGFMGINLKILDPKPAADEFDPEEKQMQAALDSDLQRMASEGNKV